MFLGVERVVGVRHITDHPALGEHAPNDIEAAQVKIIHIGRVRLVSEFQQLPAGEQTDYQQAYCPGYVNRRPEVHLKCRLRKIKTVLYNTFSSAATEVYSVRDRQVVFRVRIKSEGEAALFCYSPL